MSRALALFSFCVVFAQQPDIRVDVDLVTVACAVDTRDGTPDALQAATAIRQGATGLVTNDADLTRVSQLEVGVLDRMR